MRGSAAALDLVGMPVGGILAGLSYVYLHADHRSAAPMAKRQSTARNFLPARPMRRAVDEGVGQKTFFRRAKWCIYKEKTPPLALGDCLALAQYVSGVADQTSKRARAQLPSGAGFSVPGVCRRRRCRQSGWMSGWSSTLIAPAVGAG